MFHLFHLLIYSIISAVFAVVIPVQEKELSKIEKLYSLRLEKGEIRQFGYSVFEVRKPYIRSSAGKDYVLGPGDEVVVYFWGDPVDVLGLDSVFTQTVDREGKLFIPSLGVLSAWGKTVDELKTLLKKELSKKFRRFRIEVSLGRLREFPVYVSGYAKNPGVVSASGNMTVLDVLILAGGVSKNGSLRRITLRRTTGETVEVDLYDLLIEGKDIEVFVKEGDIVHVPPIGPTVGISGSVKRPAIYELRDESTLSDVLPLTGGTLYSTFDRNVRVIRYGEEGLKVLSGSLEDEEFLKTVVRDGDLIVFQDVTPLVLEGFTVRGKVRYPGAYSLEKYTRLSEVLKVVGLLPETDLRYGEVIRTDLKTFDREVIHFSPLQVMRGESDITLKPLDEIRFYSREIYEPVKISGLIKEPKIVPFHRGMKLLDVLRDAEFLEDPSLLKVFVFPEKKQVYLKDLLDGIAGDIELSPAAEVVVKRIKETEFRERVTILGAVKRPGVYRLREGMTLYDLIVEAGGYTEDAYPRGIIFVRESARRLQEEHLKIAIKALEESLARSEEGLGLVGASAEEKTAVQITISKQRELLNIIKERAKIGLGRIALDVPDSLEELKNSRENIKLERGDYIYVPTEPRYVLVLGDVYNQISVPYIPGKTVAYYLHQAGGPGKNADLDNIYIIKANGRVVARRNYEKFLQIAWKDNKLYFGGDFLEATVEQGDTIVVPAELKVPTMWRPLIRDVVQIIFQAISTAVLAKRL